jgi:hypothetical protein
MAPDGAWFIDDTGGVVQIFDCDGLVCSRIIWLWTARDIAGRPASDKRNSDPAFRQRLLCGLTILQDYSPLVRISLACSIRAGAEGWSGWV